MQLEEILKARSRFLQELYERTNGDQGEIDSAFEIGERLGFDEEQTIKVIQYLMNDSLISVIDETGELIQITPAGITSIERKEKEARSELLHWIYKNSHGDEKKHFDLHQFDENLGFHPRLTNRVVQFLKGEGLIRKVASRTIAITHSGVIAVEMQSTAYEETATATFANKDKKQYVDHSRIKDLKSIESDKFDLSRLVRLCEELNLAHINDCYMAIAMLVRSMLDHVPPIFGLKSFEEIANNYGGAKSFRGSMKHLNNSLRNIANAHLHVQIRMKEELPSFKQVDFCADLDVLLAEVIRILK